MVGQVENLVAELHFGALGRVEGFLQADVPVEDAVLLHGVAAHVAEVRHAVRISRNLEGGPVVPLVRRGVRDAVLADHVWPPRAHAGAQVAKGIRQGDVIVLARLRLQQTGQLPATEDRVDRATFVQQPLAPSERQLNDIARGEALPHVAGVRAALAGEAGRILHAGLAAYELLGSVADAVRPSVGDGPQVAAGEPLGEGCVEPVVV